MVVLRVDSIAARVAAASAVPAICGLVVGVVMPRGPLTTGQSLVALGLAVVTGAAAGWLLRSRWSVVLAPVVFAVAFELTRVGADGPTVDGISFDGLYAVIAFVVGRGFDGLVIGLPMVVGALWGAALRRRSLLGTPGRPGRAGRVVRRVGLGLATAFVVLLAAALARPASTAPFVDAAGEPLPGSIAELVTVDVGGHAQSVMLRGRDATAPVLLFLEGGPGGTALGSMRHAGSGLEDHFVVATWDQRGTGKSAIAREPVETLTVDQAVRDTIEVVDYLRDRFDESRVYLVGSSWGTTLGTLVVQERPDLFHAYIGSGQMVDQQETDKVMYADTLAYARRVGNQSLADRLVANGPPPYTDMLAYPVALSSNRDWEDFPHGADFDHASTYPANLFVPEYSLTEQVRGMAAMMDTFAVMYPQLQDIDFRRDVPRLDVPVFVVEGRYEAPGRSVLAEAWFRTLVAPRKEWVVFDRSGHTPHLHEPTRFAQLLADVVLPSTYVGGPDATTGPG